MPRQIETTRSENGAAVLKWTSVQCMQRAIQRLKNKGEDFRVIDMRTEEQHSVSCQAFFKAYEQGFTKSVPSCSRQQAQEDQRKGSKHVSHLLKLKDFPPSQSFLEALPRHGQVCTCMLPHTEDGHTAASLHMQVRSPAFYLLLR
jgi:hypothetical protein